MNIKGLDYNTQREKLVLPEYGREIQRMVDYCITLPDRQERQRCAQTIIATMERMNPPMMMNADYKQKLWDQLALMSDFKLDIDWPVDISQANAVKTKPLPMKRPSTHAPVRHYGKMLFELFDKLKTMAPGKERDELVELTANQMKRDLMTWGHGLCDNEKVADDLARFTDGKIQLDLNHFRFERMDQRDFVNTNTNSGKKRKRR